MVNALFYHSLKKNVECFISARLYEYMLGRGGKGWYFLIHILKDDFGCFVENNKEYVVEVVVWGDKCRS